MGMDKNHKADLIKPILSKLADLIETSEFTQTELAEQVGFTQGAISKIVTGHRLSVPLASVIVLADALNCDLVLKKRKKPKEER